MSVITDKPGLLSGIALADVPLPRTRAGDVERIIARDREDNTVTLEDEEAHAFAEYRIAARDLADLTGKMQAAQARFQAALQKLTAIVAPIEETK